MKRAISAFILLSFASALPGQQPKVSNTQIRVLSRWLRSCQPLSIECVTPSDRLWVGYEVPALPGLRMSTCSERVGLFAV